MNYTDITIKDRNVVKRYLQRQRLRDALSVVDHLDANFAGSFLDYGGGSGELSKMLAQSFPMARVFCYEPAPEIFEEARENLTGMKNVALIGSFEELKNLHFDYVFSLEVFEHLPHRQTIQAIKRLNRLLDEGGVLVIGVPNELFLSAAVKGIFRMTRRYGAFDARPSNVLKAALGRPPQQRPVKRIANGLPYHFHHTGFDHRELRSLLSETFDLVRQFGSPFRVTGPLNSEIYMVLKKRAQIPHIEGKSNK